MENVTADWNYPTRILFGYGRINELPHCCHALGISMPLLVTDPGLAELPLVAEAVQHCRDEGMKVAIFSDIKGNPTGSQIDAGAKAFRQAGHDGVIAFGGGSALDAGKAIGLIARQTVPLFELAEPDDRTVARVVHGTLQQFTHASAREQLVVVDESQYQLGCQLICAKRRLLWDDRQRIHFSSSYKGHTLSTSSRWPH